MHQGTVDLYLCKDGKTISNSELYAGDKDIYSTFRNRDPRMYHTIMPPYKVVDGKGDYTTWSYTSDPADRENLTRLASLARNLETISRKELQNESLTDAEYDLIREYGGTLEHFWIEAVKDRTDAEILTRRKFRRLW